MTTEPRSVIRNPSIPSLPVLPPWRDWSAASPSTRQTIGATTTPTRSADRTWPTDSVATQRMPPSRAPTPPRRVNFDDLTVAPPGGVAADAADLAEHHGDAARPPASNSSRDGRLLVAGAGAPTIPAEEERHAHPSEHPCRPRPVPPDVGPRDPRDRDRRERLGRRVRPPRRERRPAHGVVDGRGPGAAR